MAIENKIRTAVDADARHPALKRPGEFRLDGATKEQLRTFFADMRQPKVGGITVLEYQPSVMPSDPAASVQGAAHDPFQTALQAAQAAFVKLNGSWGKRQSMTPVEVARIQISGAEYFACRVPDVLGRQARSTGALVDAEGKLVAVLSDDRWKAPFDANQNSLQAWTPASGKPQAESVARATDVPKGMERLSKDRLYDGYFIGQKGQIYPPETPVDQIPPITPENWTEPKLLLVHVNGMMRDVATHTDAMEDLAKVAGVSVLGIHYGSKALEDLVNVVRLKGSIGQHPAVDSVANVMWNALEKGQAIRFVAHSLGGLVVSEALSQVKKRFMETRGMTEEQATEALGKIQVVTQGAAAQSYPDGPDYEHVLNAFDPIVSLVGAGVPFSKLGAGANVRVVYDLNIPRNVPSFFSGPFDSISKFFNEWVHGPSTHNNYFEP